MLRIGTKFDTCPWRRELAERLLDENITIPEIRRWCVKEKSQFIEEQTLRRWRSKLIRLRRVRVNADSLRQLFRDLIDLKLEHEEIREQTTELDEKRKETALITNLILKAVQVGSAVIKIEGLVEKSPEEMKEGFLSELTAMDGMEKDRIIEELEGELEQLGDKRVAAQQVAKSVLDSQIQTILTEPKPDPLSMEIFPGLSCVPQPGNEFLTEMVKGKPEAEQTEQITESGLSVETESDQIPEPEGKETKEALKDTD